MLAANRSKRSWLASAALADGAAAGSGILCSGCSIDLSDMPYAELVDGRNGQVAEECQHFMGFTCFGLAHSKRSLNIELACRALGCCYSTEAWHVHSPSGRSGGRQQTLVQSIDRPSSHGDILHHPNLFFKYI